MAVLGPAFEGWQRGWLRTDVVAGLTVWAVLVPESLAYATIAGVSPVVGLYAAVPALMLYALVGTSRHLVVAPMSATAALSFGIVSDLATGDASFAALTAALALASGTLAIVAGLLRLGFLASFISEPVLKGFIIGLALTIMVGQIPALLGVEKGSGSFVEKAWWLVLRLDDVDGSTAAVGLVSLMLLLVLRRAAPLVPASLVVALMGILAAVLLHLDEHGVAVVGVINPGLPSLGLPDVAGSDLLALLGASAGVMLVGFAEGLGAAKTYAARAGYDVDPNRELTALGVANMGAGLAQGMVVNGSLSKTAVNGAAGARTPASSVTAAVLTIVTLLLLTGLFEQLPEATLAAIVIAAVVDLVDFHSLASLWRRTVGPLTRLSLFARQADFLAALTALLGVLVLDTLPGLVLGVVVSLILLIGRTSRPNVAVLGAMSAEDGRRSAWVDVRRHPDAPPVPGVLVVRVEAPLMFANADYVRDRVRRLAAAQAPPVRLVVLDAETVPGIDVTASDMLHQLGIDLRRIGAALVVARGIGQVRDLLLTGEKPYPPVVGSVDDALARFTENG